MRELTLGDALEILIDHRGKTPKKLGGDFTPTGVRVASAQLVREGRLFLDEARSISLEMYERWMPVPTKKHDVLVTYEAPLGRVALVPDDEPLVLGQRLFGLRGKAGVLDSRFLYYAFQTDFVQDELSGRATGTTVLGIRQAELVKIRILVPSFEEQQRISALLGALDDKIAVNDQIVRTSHQLAQALTVEALSGVERARLDELAEVTMGSSPSGETYNEDGVGLSFYQGTRDFGFRFPSQRVWCSAPVRVAPAGAILVSVRAPVGRLNVTTEECCIGRGLAALVSKSGTPSLLFHSLSAVSELWAPFEAEGTVFGAINKKQLGGLSVPLVDPRIARPLEEVLAALDAQVKRSFLETASLRGLRDALLPALMSGEIRVREAEELVEDIA